MNQIIIQDVADTVVKLRMFPYFDICNYILMSISVRDDTPQSSCTAFSRRHPFACWFATMLMCFGGSILCDFVTSQPIFSCFDDHKSVILATIVWYLINYAPFDLFYRFCKIFPVRLLICCLKEVQRTKKISIGVHHGMEHFPRSTVMPILLGMLKGAGYCEMKLLERLVRGVWLPASTEFLHPTLTTKLSLVSAAAFFADYLGLVPLPSNQLFLAIMSLLIYMRLSMLILGLKDPLLPLENIVCTLLFGGLVDAMKAAFDKRAAAAAVNLQTQQQANLDGGMTSSAGQGTPGDANNANGGVGQNPVNLNGSVPLGDLNSTILANTGAVGAASGRNSSLGDKKRD